MPDLRRALGQSGEDRAAAWYEANGYVVLARNWRCRDGELDLVLRKGDVLVFSEVKARTTTLFGAPVEAVTRTKQLRLRRLAALWLDDTGVRVRDLRFDVVSVLADQIEVVEGAF